MSRSIPWTVREYGRRPGGPITQFQRFLEELRKARTEPGQLAPEYIRETAAIPLNETEEGGRQYLTGLGLMEEDTWQTLGPLLRGDYAQTMREFGSALRPGIKAPIELMMGQSLFQRGPFGGRPLPDMNPPVAQTIENIKRIPARLRGQKLPPQRGQLKSPLGVLGEHLVANSPASKLVQTARRLTGMMADPNAEVGKELANLASGIRFYNVRPGVQDRLLQDELAKELKQLGGRNFEVTYVPEETKEAMSPERRMSAETVLLLQQEIRERQKERAQLERELRKRNNPLLQY